MGNQLTMNPLEQALNKKAGKAGDKKMTAKGESQTKKDKKFVGQLGAIKEHVTEGKKSGGFNDPFWYSKK